MFLTKSGLIWSWQASKIVTTSNLSVQSASILDASIWINTRLLKASPFSLLKLLCRRTKGRGRKVKRLIDVTSAIRPEFACEPSSPVRMPLSAGSSYRKWLTFADWLNEALPTWHQCPKSSISESSRLKWRSCSAKAYTVLLGKLLITKKGSLTLYQNFRPLFFPQKSDFLQTGFY